MTSATRTLLVAACLPIALAGCSSSSHPASEPTSSPSQTAQAKLPIATSYVVKAGKGVSDDDLKSAVVKIKDLPGLRRVWLPGSHTLRVDLAFDQPDKQRAAVLAEMRKLGTVSVPLN